MSGGVDPDLVIGAILGLVAAAAFVLVPSVRTAWPAVLAAAAVVALLGVDQAPRSLLVGVGVAAGAGFLAVPHMRLAVGAGGAAIAMATLSDPVGTGTRVGLAVVAVGAGVALADLEARRGPALVAVLGMVTLAGMFLTVPDTESILVVIAVVGPAAVVAVRAPPAAAGQGAIGLLVVVLWVMAQEGRARPGSIVGGVACLGVLVLEPLVHRVVGDDAQGPPELVLVALQAVVVLFAARVAGFQDHQAPAAVLAAAALVPAALVLFAATRRAVR